MRLIRVVLWVIVIVLISGSGCITVSAKEKESDPIEQFNELYDRAGVEEIWYAVPEESRELLRKNGIGEISPSTLINLDAGRVFTNIIDMCKSPIDRFANTFFSLLGVLLVAAIIDAIKHSFNSEQYNNVFEAVTVLSTAGVILSGAIGLVNQVIDKLEQTNQFILSFIPVYSGIILASGKPLTAAAYNGALFTAIQVITTICAQMLLPLISIYLAITIVCSVGNMVNISSIGTSINKLVVWVLSFCMTIFIGILSIQSVIATGADNIGLKATRFAMSSFVPVVGGAIGDALASVYGALGLLKSTVGSFGIITVAVSFLPILIDIVMMMLILNITVILADILAVTSVSSICKNISRVLGLLLGIMLCFIVMIIISVSLMILVTG